VEKRVRESERLMKNEPKPTRILLQLGLLVGLVLLFSTLVVFPPDRPVATIVPGSSSGPAFVVQIIRPRVGLPLGGVLPPQLFGVEEHLGFASTSPGASIGSVRPERFEFVADDWDLALVVDAEGRVTPETAVVFELLFEEQRRRVRCRPGDPAVGTFSTTELKDTGERSGSFDIELPHCEDADTGKPLGWPPKPFVLHGSFDRLPLDAASERR
jgi:hypothetical protein